MKKSYFIIKKREIYSTYDIRESYLVYKKGRNPFSSNFLTSIISAFIDCNFDNDLVQRFPNKSMAEGYLGLLWQPQFIWRNKRNKFVLFEIQEVEEEWGVKTLKDVCNNNEEIKNKEITPKIIENDNCQKSDKDKNIDDNKIHPIYC